MIRTVKLAVCYATGIMVVGVTIFQLFPHLLLGLFDASDYMLEIGVPALRIICLSFLLAGFGIVSSSFFQALGHGGFSLIISLVRQLIVLLPAAWLLSLSGQLGLVWWAFPIAEIFSGILSVLFLLYAYRKEVKPMLAE